MGKAVITEMVGEGLHKAKLIYKTSGLEAEIAGLEAQSLAYWRELNQALDHLKLLRRDRGMYRETLDALIQQWKAILEEKTQWPPPPAVPEDADEDENNPATGLPYTNEEREAALGNEVADKINEARVAAGLAPFDRSTTLDRQMIDRVALRTTPLDVFPDFLGRDGYLELLTRQQSIQERGKTIHDAILTNAPGVVFDAMEEAMVVGPSSSVDTITALQNDPTVWGLLMNPGANELGVAYRYNPAHPGSHIWNVGAATVRSAPPGNAAFFAAPAGQALVAAMEIAIGPVQAAGLKQGLDGGSGGGGSGGGSWEEVWAANTEYGIGAAVQGNRRNGGKSCLAKMTGRYGRSGDTEPLWPAKGQSVGDNDLTWTVLSNIPDEVTGTILDYYASQ